MTRLDYRSKAKGRAIPAEEAKHWVVPVVLMGIGFACFVIAGFVEAGAEGAAVAGILGLVVGIVETVLLVIASIVTSVLFKIGFDDLRWGTLRLAAAGIFSTGLDALIPFPFVGTVAFLIVLVTLMDLEWWEAIVFTLIYGVIAIAVGAALAVALADAF